MYGDTQGKPLSEELPYAANTRKGKVRAAMANSLLEAHRLGQVRVASARGADFYGPGVLAQHWASAPLRRCCKVNGLK